MRSPFQGVSDLLKGAERNASRDSSSIRNVSKFGSVAALPVVSSMMSSIELLHGYRCVAVFRSVDYEGHVQTEFSPTDSVSQIKKYSDNSRLTPIRLSLFQLQATSPVYLVPAK